MSTRAAAASRAATPPPPPPAPQSPAAARRVWLPVLYWGLVALHLVPVWMVPRLPTQDGPSHLYQAVVLARHAHEPLLREHFALNLVPVPNWGGYGVLWTLLQVLPPFTAEKVAVSLYVLGFAAACLWMVRSFTPGATLPALAMLPLVLGYHLWLGLYAFTFALPLFLLTVGCWQRTRAWRPPARVLLLGGLLAVGWLAHLVTWLAALSVVLVLEWATAGRAGWRRALVLSALLLVPSAAALAWYCGRLPPLQYSTWTAAATLVYLRDLGPAVTCAEHQLWTRPLLVLLVLWSVAPWVWRRSRHGTPRSAARERPSFAAWAAVAWLLLLFVLVPDSTSSGGLLKPRLLLLALLLLSCVLRLPHRPWARSLLAGALSALVLLHLVTTTRFVAAAHAELNEFMSGVDAVPERRLLVHVVGALGAVPGAPDVGRRLTSPLCNGGDGYAIERVGVNLCTFHATNENFPVLLRHRGSLLEALGRAQYVILWGAGAQETTVLLDTGRFRQVFASPSGRLLVYRRE